MISPKEKMKALRDAHDRIAPDGYKVRQILARANQARRFPGNTCTLSRHLKLAGERLIKEGAYQLFEDDPLYMGISLVEAATLIWELRDALSAVQKSIGEHKKGGK